MKQKTSLLSLRRTAPRLASLALALAMAAPLAHAADELPLTEIGESGNKAGFAFLFPNTNAELADGKSYTSFEVQVITPWKPGKPGTAILTGVAVTATAASSNPKTSVTGATAGTSLISQAGTHFSIPEFVWAKSKATAGDISYPVYRIVAIADTVLNDFSTPGSTTITHLYLPPSVPTLDFAKALKNNWKSFFKDETLTVRINPTFVLFGSEGSIADGSHHFYEASDNDAGVLAVEGALAVAKDLNFDIAGKDARDLEVSKADLALAANFFKHFSKDGKGELIIGKFDDAEVQTGNDHAALLVTTFSLGADAFKADSLAKYLSSLVLGSTLSGSLKDAGFAAFQNKKDFSKIDFSKVTLFQKDGSKKDILSKPVFKLDGDGLFLGTKITSLLFPTNLTTVGNKWFKNAEITHLGSSFTANQNDGSTDAGDLGKSITSIGDEAFRNAYIGGASLLALYVNLNASITTTTGIPYNADGSLKSGFSTPFIKSIGKSAFQDFQFAKIAEKANPIFAVSGTKTYNGFYLGLAEYASEIGDSAFAGISTSTGISDNVDYRFALDGIHNLIYTHKLGKGVFHGDLIYLIESDKHEKNPVHFNVPFQHLKDAPASIFGGALFTKAAQVKVYTSDYAETETTDTLAISGFFLSEKFTPASGIHKDAFGPQDTVYAHFSSFEGWKSQLSGAKIVQSYGFNEEATTTDNRLVKLVSGRSGEEINYEGYDGTDNPSNPNYAKLSLGYNFAKDGKTSRTLSFKPAYDKNYIYYSIQGPAGIPGYPSIVTGKDVDGNDSLRLITEDLALDGITVPPLSPAGLYIIQLYNNKKQPSKYVNNGTEVLQYLLQITPTNFDHYSADTVSLPFVGSKNIVAALKDLYTLYSVELYDADDAPEGDLAPESAEIRIDSSLAVTLKADSSVYNNVVIVKGKGNYVGEISIPLQYLPLSLKDVTAINIPPVDFKIGQKEFKATDDISLSVTQQQPKSDLTFSYTFTVPQQLEDDSVSTSLAIDYTGAIIGKPGNPQIALTGFGELSDKTSASYEIKANWKDYASFPTTGDKYLVSDKPQTFAGKSFLEADLHNLIAPFNLEPSQYKVIATPENTEGTYDKVAEVLENKVDLIFEALTYDLYILPAGDLVDKYTDAAYIGYIKIEPLPINDFLKALKVVKLDTPASGSDSGSGSGSGSGSDAAAPLYSLLLDQSIYADPDFKAELDASNDTFLVSINPKALSSIEGLQSASFKYAIPKADPTELILVNIPAEWKNTIYILIGETLDLNHFIDAANNDVAFDFKDHITWSNDDADGTPLSLDGSLLSASSKWNGSLSATFTPASGAPVSISIPVKAVSDLPTFVESVVKDTKSIVYSDGTLSIQGFDGSLAAIYSLNGSLIAAFPVASSDAAFSFSLPAGFYLVKVGPAVTKFIVK